MDIRFTTYTVVYMGAAAIALTVALFIWQRRTAPGARWLFLLMLAAAQWSFCDALDLSSTTLEGHIFWAKWSYIGGTSIAVFLLLFALEFTNRSRYVTPAFVTAYFIVPLGVTVATFFNEAHMLTWTGFVPAPQDPTILVYQHGPLYWFVTLYLTTLMLVATVLLVRFAIRNKDLYAFQSGAIVVATMIPWAALMVYDFLPDLWPGVDPSVAMVASGAIFTVSMFKFQLLDLAPIAHEVLVRNMDDGVVVLDAAGRIADLNPAARRILGVSRPIGLTVSQALSDSWPDAARGLGRAGSEAVPFESTSPSGRIVRFSTTPLRDAVGRRGGCLVTVDDLTDSVAAERALQAANDALTERLAEIEHLHADLSEQAIRDPLTGLYNRRYLDETMSRELGRAQREGYPVSIVMLDIDHFKQVNDDSGHAAGDLVLKLLAAQLVSQTRPGDIACRYGGDEFVVVLANANAPDALHRAEGWRERFNTASVGLTGLEPATISLGVATYPVDGGSVELLFAAADRAVYAAKAAGRNCVAQDSGPYRLTATS